MVPNLMHQRPILHKMLVPILVGQDTPTLSDNIHDYGKDFVAFNYQIIVVHNEKAENVEYSCFPKIPKTLAFGKVVSTWLISEHLTSFVSSFWFRS